MPKPLVWVKIKTAEGNVPPSARLGHTLVEIENDFFVMYGGLDINSRIEGNITPNKDVYTLKVNPKNEYYWTLTECEGEGGTGEVPLPRTNHSACRIGDHEMLIFGGYFTSKKRFNDLHILKTNKGIFLSLLFST